MPVPNLLLLVHLLLLLAPIGSASGAASDLLHGHGGDSDGHGSSRRAVIDVEGGPDSVVWVVQLSDLHFSVHHPERAVDFKRLVGPALAMIKPSLVLITGDLTDGKSKDLLIMKQDEKEWIEYQNVMADIVKMSGIDKESFYDLRGNHDHFGVPAIGGAYDFYSKYSSNAGAGRIGNVHSITLKSSGWKHLFVGFDSTTDIGIRGPTNLFGHPSDHLLADLDLELSQWDSEFRKFAVTKIAFGHFPLSFSAVSDSGRSLKEIFLKHSLSAYLCGHLHSRFGKNLKRHHISSNNFPFSGDSYQLNIHPGTIPSDLGKEDCSEGLKTDKEFWEWEMGDWRKSRAMRILAIDAGHVSFLDTDFSLGSKKTIILPTFPLDSRFMQRLSSHYDFFCETKASYYKTIRALVFSEMGVDSVFVKIYDSRPGVLNLVMESTMTKHNQNDTRGNLYEAPWNWRAFVDSSPDRYWLQVEVVDNKGGSTFSQLRPFSVNGLIAKVDWHWNEFRVMGLQWGSLYRPILWATVLLLFSLLLIPRAALIYSKNNNHSNAGPSFSERGTTKFAVYWLFWVLLEFSKQTLLWSCVFMYLLFLIFFPWFSGHAFTETGHIGHMTIHGWSITVLGKRSYLGMPDIMVVVLPHLCLVVLPSMLAMFVLVAEKSVHRLHYLSLSGKKQDDNNKDSKQHMDTAGRLRAPAYGRRWTRKVLLLICLAILWKHWNQCRALVKAYEMNPFINSLAYCFTVPVLLVYTFYTTAAVQKS